MPQKSILFRWSIGLYRNQWFIEQGQRLIMALDLMIASHPIKAKIAFKSSCMLMGKLAVKIRFIKNHTSITSAYYGCVTKNCDALKVGLTKIKSCWWHKRRNDISMRYYAQVQMYMIYWWKTYQIVCDLHLCFSQSTNHIKVAFEFSMLS